ncbi:MAG: TIGR02646 family protein [Clostridia bacterium]|nr:TIGR02646 family protein [Clostridia bacterium]
MHKVERNQAPESLIRKNEKYLSNLDNGKNMNKPWDSLSDKNRKEVLQSLEEMYHGCCAYCESDVEAVSNPHIDHFRPKSLFPRLVFEYSNLNYACQKCNQYKLDKWDESFFSPTDEDPEEHIRFVREAAIPLDERGNKMIEVLKLNREKVIARRREKYNTMAESIRVANEQFNEIDYTNQVTLKFFIKLFDIAYNKFLECSSVEMPYSTMVKHNFSQEIEKLLLKRDKVCSYLNQ